MFKPTSAKTPEEYIEKIEEPRRSDIKALHEMILRIAPDLKPYILVGMIGYGTYHYKYASGREGDWAPVALASQKNYISLYVCAVKDGQYITDKYRARLPKADIGKSCVRFKKLNDVSAEVLEQLIDEGSKIKEFAA